MGKPKAIISLALIGFLAGYTFQKLPLAFFQQDEWHTFAGFIYQLSQSKVDFFLNSVKGGMLGHFTPLTIFFFLPQFLLFGFNFAPYACLSILFHLTNSWLVYFLVTRLTKERVIGFLAGVFFATWSISLQAVTWIGNYVGTLGSTFFLLLSLIFFLKYLEEKKFRKHYYYSLGLFLISLGFKETTTFLFIFFPIWSFLNIRKKRNNYLSWLKEQRPLVICFFIYMGLRALTLLTEVKKYSVAADSVWDYLPITLYNLIMMPLATVSQIFVPEKVINSLVHLIPASFFKSQFLSGVRIFPVIPATFVSVLLTFFMLVLLAGLIRNFWRRGEKKEVGVIIFGLIWIGLAVLPFVLLGKPFAFLESRYYYVPAVGAALLLGMVAFWVADRVSRKLGGIETRDGIFYGLLALMVVPVLFFHSTKIRQGIKRDIEIASEQKAILNEIKKTYPAIGEKSIFYVEPLMYPTFYSGFGHTLMVNYAREGQLNPEFFKDDFLWGVQDQGYQEIEDSGFGYFRQYSELLEAIRKFNLTLENVYAFRYDKETKQLKNITKAIKESQKYFGQTGYIANPQSGRKLLGVPDGQRRSFYSDAFVLTEIKEVSNLANNEKWLAGDFIAQETPKAISGTKDYFITYNYGLEASYGGAHLVYHMTGNDSDVYQIPGRLYGYQVAGFSSISTALKGNAITKNITQKKDGSFEVTLWSAFSLSQTIEFNLLLNTKVLYYQPGKGVNEIVMGQVAETSGDGISNRFVVPLSGSLKSLRSFWENDDLRYQPQAFVDGVMTPIISWSGLDTTSLSIEFKKAPNDGALIKIPVLVTFAPLPDDIIRIVNF